MLHPQYRSLVGHEPRGLLQAFLSSRRAPVDRRDYPTPPVLAAVREVSGNKDWPHFGQPDQQRLASRGVAGEALENHTTVAENIKVPVQLIDATVPERTIADGTESAARRRTECGLILGLLNEQRGPGEYPHVADMVSMEM